MRLLIVEDEQGMAEGLRALLEKQGYVTDLAFDGDSGLDNGLTGLYDLIILDIMLPKRDGLSVLEELRRTRADLRAVQGWAVSRWLPAGKDAGTGGDPCAASFSKRELRETESANQASKGRL